MIRLVGADPDPKDGLGFGLSGHQGGLNPSELTERAIGSLIDGEAGGGRCETPVGATVEERRGEPTLSLAQAMAEGGLADGEIVSGAGHRAEVNDRYHRLVVTEVEQGRHRLAHARNRLSWSSYLDSLHRILA